MRSEREPAAQPRTEEREKDDAPVAWFPRDAAGVLAVRSGNPKMWTVYQSASTIADTSPSPRKLSIVKNGETLLTSAEEFPAEMPIAQQLEQMVVGDVRARWMRGDGNGPKCDAMLAEWGGGCGERCQQLVIDCVEERRLNEPVEVSDDPDLDGGGDRIRSSDYRRRQLATESVAATVVPLSPSPGPIPQPCVVPLQGLPAHVRKMELLCSGRWNKWWCCLPDGKSIRIEAEYDGIRDSNLPLEIESVIVTGPAPCDGRPNALGFCIKPVVKGAQ